MGFGLSGAAELVWVEGESAGESSMRRHGWYDSVKKAELSGDEWLSHFGEGVAPVARYSVEVEDGGSYAFWVRANPVGAAMSVRWNGGSWGAVNFKGALENTNIASDGKADLRFVAWVRVGVVGLKKGLQQLEVRFESGNSKHGGLDCFVLSNGGFVADGRLKPGEKTGLAEAGKWAFEPGADLFSDEAVLDLSGMNVKPAGKAGYVGRSRDGASFVDGGGRALRFWAVNTSVQRDGGLERLERHAKFLAKRGVNMVRHHGHLAPGRGSRLSEVNEVEVERVWKLVAAMKKEGIYTTFSPYWGSHTKVETGWGLEDAGNENLAGLLFFDVKLQAAYKGWLRALLEPVNPHTGVALAKDPALAIFQIQNEDSLLFWTEQAIKGEQRKVLGRRFGAWLVEKYGSLEKAVDGWGSAVSIDGDDYKSGLVMPQGIWHLTQDASGAGAKRMGDQLAFYGELMAVFNAEIARFLREDLGCEALVNAGNWRTADAGKLLDVERWSYTATDVIGVNRYYGGGAHVNPAEGHKAGYQINVGDRFEGQSVLKNPWAFPLGLRQVAGYPMIVSESQWVPPLGYQVEGPFLVAAYGAMGGVDVFYWFSTGELGFGRPMGKWQINSPAQMGMFPAAALMFRGGYVRQGAVVVEERRRLDELWERRLPAVVEEAGFDPNRDEGAGFVAGIKGATPGGVSPLAYLAGPVEVAFGAEESEVLVAGALGQLIDPGARVVQSVTGQLSWDYGDGVCVLDAPAAQGVCGFLDRAGVVKTGAVTVKSGSEYGSVLVVSMDGEALERSAKVLVQIGTVARPYGWKTREVRLDGGRRGEEITSLGSSPWNLDRFEGEMRVANPGLSEAVVVDGNGMVVRALELEKDAGGVRLRLPEDALYVVLR